MTTLRFRVISFLRVTQFLNNNSRDLVTGLIDSKFCHYFTKPHKGPG